MRPHLGVAFARIAPLLAPLLALLAAPVPSHAQDFDGPAPAGPSPLPAPLLERALPGGAPALRLEALAVEWGGLGDFTTRALVIGAGCRAARIAAGLSSTGDPELGWNAAALGAGCATGSFGAGLRVIGRRDRSGDSAPRAAGLEVGGGFWAALPRGAVLWASLPALATAGESPPLDRGLESGARGRAGELSLWLGWSAPVRAADTGERLAGVALERGQAAVWFEARDRPLRASFGIRGERGPIGVGFAVSEHPVLGETVRLALTARADGTP